MKRRKFVMLLGGTAATWPLVARTQQSGNRLPQQYISQGNDLTHDSGAAIQQLFRRDSREMTTTTAALS